jgi:hypothetical protein
LPSLRQPQKVFISKVLSQLPQFPLQFRDSTGDATSGTFQGVNLATTPGFRVTDGRGGVVTAADLSIALMDGAYRRVMGASGKSPDFYIGDPAAIDKFSQSLLAQFRWDVKYTRLATGWEGVDYRGTPLIPEFDMSAGVVFGVNKSALPSMASVMALSGMTRLAIASSASVAQFRWKLGLLIMCSLAFISQTR